MRFLAALVWMVVTGSVYPCTKAGDEPMMVLKFEDYPVKAVYRGKPAAPRLDHAGAKRYRTAIRQWAAQGPNFAGELTIAEHGCGTCCKGFFIVNARTGTVYPRTFGVACHYKDEVPGYGLVALDHRVDSNLLIVRGARNEKGGGEYYYLWQGGRLKLLKALEEPCQ